MVVKSVKMPPELVSELQDLARYETLRRRRVIYWSDLLREGAVEYIRSLRGVPAPSSAIH